MVDQQVRKARQGRRRRVQSTSARRPVDYRHLKNPFQPQIVFSDDHVEAIHASALRVLEELGIRILLPEGREIFRNAGAIVDDETQMVQIGSDLVDQALKSAPRSIRLRAACQEREQLFEPGAMLFAAGAGCPNVYDMQRGRRPGSLRDYEETLKLQQSFDVIHIHGPSAEPQDVPVHLRHYAMMRGQLALGDKPSFVYARGNRQVAESFEMIRLARGLSPEDFQNGVWANTVINSNSPRQLDIPMTQGIIDFARAGQMSIITPFCLAGAMAPITIAGALTLQHAEALAGITLAQLCRTGAPVCYGGFASNVDMKSGSPAFGTPEHVKMSLGSGQLARHIGLPWRSAAGAASNTTDSQATHETLMSTWGAVLAGATLTIHAAGWLEGGLCFGYEKFINDIEALQTFAELCIPTTANDDDIGFSAIQDVQPGGHFFATQHTMERYDTAFYVPLVADVSNHGAWLEAGAQNSAQRATNIWKETLENFTPPKSCDGVGERLEEFIAERTKAGGAHPED